MAKRRKSNTLKKAPVVKAKDTEEAKAFDQFMEDNPPAEIIKPESLVEVQCQQYDRSNFVAPKPVPVRFTGSHQICPRCGAMDTKVYKSMPIDPKNNIRVQYRRCSRGPCRAEFKATFTVV